MVDPHFFRGLPVFLLQNWGFNLKNGQFENVKSK